MPTIATWNVNSVRARLERLLGWIDENHPDVLLLQETKVEDGDFPTGELEALGYKSALFGQRAYNGVAVLSRHPIDNVVRGLCDDVDDPAARLIAATTAGVRVLSVYAPNGQTVDSDKFAYKLAWFNRLRQYLDSRCDPTLPVCVGGDFNVAPEPRDVHDPAAWEESVLFHPAARAALETLRGFGLKDAMREKTQEAGLYSWWDYRMLSFPKNRGLRIDHLLLTRPLAGRLETVRIDRNARKGKGPSDHAPVIATFA
jgi:exodeoxyribonuclease-3